MFEINVRLQNTDNLWEKIPTYNAQKIDSLRRETTSQLRVDVIDSQRCKVDVRCKILDVSFSYAKTDSMLPCNNFLMGDWIQELLYMFRRY